MNINISYWKYIFSAPLLFALVAITLSFSSVVENYSLTTAKDIGTKNIDQLRAIRNYYANHILTEALNANLATDTNHRDSKGTVPAPATFLHDMSEVITESGTESNLYSPYPWPNRAGRVLDERQQKAWDLLSTNPDAVYTEFSVSDAGERIVYVGYADTLNSELCVDCHNNHPDTPIAGWSLNDTRGVLEVTVNVESLMQRGETIGYIFSGVIGGLVLLSLLMGFGIDRTIGRPLVVISKSALKMLDGVKLDTIPYGNRKDEMGILSRALERLTRYIDEHERVLMLEAQEAKAQATRTMKLESLLKKFDKEINKTSNDINDSIKIIYDIARNLTNNSLETSDQITSISSSTDEMNRNIRSVSESGQQLSETISTVFEQVTKSRNIAESASTQADDANLKIKGLADAAQRIGEVVDLINDIANQTNLLALNATIEAARAGEAGKGFAVVAGEVKNLANQTAKATEEISSQIHNIQSETNYAVEAIAEVTGVVSTINTLAGDIANAINTQTDAVREISNNAEQTATGTLQVLEGLNSVANAATGTGDMAKVLLEDTEKLNELSGCLADEIKLFHHGVIEIETMSKQARSAEAEALKEEINHIDNMEEVEEKIHQPTTIEGEEKYNSNHGISDIDVNAGAKDIDAEVKDADAEVKDADAEVKDATNEDANKG